MTTTATVTSKDQITIAAQIRRDLELKPGNRVLFVKSEKAKSIVKPKPD